MCVCVCVCCLYRLHKAEQRELKKKKQQKKLLKQQVGVHKQSDLLHNHMYVPVFICTMYLHKCINTVLDTVLIINLTVKLDFTATETKEP